MKEETPEEGAERLMQYLDLKNTNFIREIKGARTSGEMRELIMAYTSPGYNLSNLFAKPSPWADKVAKYIQQKLVGDEKDIKVPKVSPKKVKKDVPVKLKGKIYYKSKPKRYTIQEKIFIKQADKRGLTNRELFEEFNKMEGFESRSFKGLIAKRRRLKK